jgi:hypothetical protein
MVSAERPAAAYSRHEPATITAENFRLRKERYDAWRQADATMDYWLAAMKMHSSISCMQNFGASEGDRYPFIEPEEHGTLVNKYRLAWCKLMLTPAPNSGHVRWKRMQLIAENWKYTGLSPERIEQAIAADVEWLEAHPVRGSKRKPSNSGQEHERAHPARGARRPARIRRFSGRHRGYAWGGLDHSSAVVRCRLQDCVGRRLILAGKAT